ncbi:hypothetical protein SAMN05444416_108105 [Thermoactinomyces sp. DSM 45892]|nr:hypothetical protein SAMN05444416_108105 [Thermoactinomyces sp. DSM 45892]
MWEALFLALSLSLPAKFIRRVVDRRPKEK